MPGFEEVAVACHVDRGIFAAVPQHQIEVRGVSGECDIGRSVAAACGDAFGCHGDVPTVIGVLGMDDHRLGARDRELLASWRESGEQLVDPVTLVTKVRFIDPDSDFHRLARFLETCIDN